jgi:hypothetical protein
LGTAGQIYTVDERGTFEEVLQEYGVRVMLEFKWLRIGTSGKLLCTW